jgi:hypothetical protein
LNHRVGHFSENSRGRSDTHGEESVTVENSEPFTTKVGLAPRGNIKVIERIGDINNTTMCATCKQVVAFSVQRLHFERSLGLIVN